MSPTALKDRTKAIRLDSWKGISKYMGRGTRTVQRWHAELNLPVRHIGGVSTSVFAFSDELDRWLRTFTKQRGAN
jgi:hypothetical protein